MTQRWKFKAKLAANGIQALANTVRGVKDPLLQQDTIACVVCYVSYIIGLRHGGQGRED